jgi:hypothetical protein
LNILNSNKLTRPPIATESRLESREEGAADVVDDRGGKVWTVMEIGLCDGRMVFLMVLC